MKLSTALREKDVDASATSAVFAFTDSAALAASVVAEQRRGGGAGLGGASNQIDNNLPKKHFKQVHISLAQALKIPGLILTWEHTYSALGQRYGHTANTTGNGRSSTSDWIERDTRCTLIERLGRQEGLQLDAANDRLTLVSPPPAGS